MSVHELRALTVGSVLIKRVDEANVRVNGKAAFTGSFGSNGDVRAVRLQMFVKEVMC